VHHLEADEKAIATRHRCVTVLADFDRGQVLSSSTIGNKRGWMDSGRPSHQRITFHSLQQGDFNVAGAWALEDHFGQPCGCTYLGVAQTVFTRWFWWGTRSCLKPMAAVANLLERHLSNVLTYLWDAITNVGLETLNATIQCVKKTARGVLYGALQDSDLLPLVRLGRLPTRIRQRQEDTVSIGDRSISNEEGVNSWA